MPTISQLLRKPRVKPLARNKVPALEKQPISTKNDEKSMQLWSGKKMLQKA